MKNKQTLFTLIRYFVLILLASGNLFLIYAVANPATIEASFFFIQLMYPDATPLGDNTIFFKGYYATIIPACVAGAAYYLLLILNLTTPMPAKKRVKSLLFLVLAFYIINLARILVFAKLFEAGYNYFDLTHTLTWYLGSTVMVIILWFANIYAFKIKEIPIYTDFKNIIKDIRQ